MQSFYLHWHKDQYNLFWCRFNSELLKDPHLTHSMHTFRGTYDFRVTGIYIIWAGIDKRTNLYVGSGVIKDRFRDHLTKPEIQRYNSQGLYDSWATIPTNTISINDSPMIR